jgi:hypothetical protein
MSDGVTGLGGVFSRACDPGALKAWYERVLGVPGQELMRSDGLVFGIFRADTEGNRFELWEAGEGM